MRILVIAPIVDGTDVGEAFVAYKWAQMLSERVDLTVCSFERPGRTPLAEQLPRARVISWPEPAVARLHERLNAMAKPAWPVFSRKVRRWLTQALDQGERFDVTHQLMPLAARYPTPLRFFDIPYVIGPLGGTLETPEGFEGDTGSAPLYTRLRKLDAWRFRNDPWLRASYAGAAAVMGVAPYVRDALHAIPLKRFEPFLELGIDDVAEPVTRPPVPGQLRLLHVGRGVRTKGLRDTIRALAHLSDLPGVTLTSAGDGEEIALCRAEAEALGVADRVTFMGRVPRDEVETLYRTHDVFCFPSFREPTGGVLYEAMRWGLPIITAARGGPDWIIDDSCGIRIPVTEPQRYAQDIAQAVRDLLDNPAKRESLGREARTKVLREGLWSEKGAKMVDFYRNLATS